ncbi:hypothetical protein [Meridianimarinicoccus aquatilis]|uniref:Uncharacterized protein n=1 Tax=Meridianimarinicoccus aquatilis TaxID=2552766 RepID=A0A4R6B2H5_9RHOB|nr:hypothetical protein [Fluviibacterium aquatile]TDL89378.1 hypothetical protein E2L05_06930 [Fluviibacterium aquatile]
MGAALAAVWLVIWGLSAPVRAASLMPGETTCGLECIEVDLPGSAMDGADEDDEILQPRFEAEQEFLGDIEGPATVDGKADAASDLLSQPDR